MHTRTSWMPPFLAIVAVVLAAAVPSPAPAQQDTAQAIPHCTASVLGATACLDGILCECTELRGGSISGQRSGPQWNCDALRPRCGDAAQAGVPATLPPTAFPYPNAVGIDRSENNVIIDQKIRNRPTGTPSE